MFFKLWYSFEGGGRKIPASLENSISFFLKENSNPASNRAVLNKNTQSSDYGKVVPVHYLEDNKTELFKKFKFSSHLSKSTFMKYLNAERIYKKPFR